MGDLIFRIKSRRESAFLDHDANLARLLADCVEEIEKLEKDNDWLKSQLEKAKIALKLAEYIMVKNSVYPDDLYGFNKALKEIEGLG